VDFALGETQRALAQAYASLRINELLNWQVAAADGVGPADASVTEVFASERLQHLGQLLEEVVGRHGDPAGEETAELARWLDIQPKRNTVLTFGGGVNEIQRELIATAGLGVPGVPR
jgi:3-oxo-4-pregnene-20-carboxyl-CoA dehydrogenase beta subunit